MGRKPHRRAGGEPRHSSVNGAAWRRVAGGCGTWASTPWRTVHHGRAVGAPGFEPGTSCPPDKRANQAAPRPVGDDVISTRPRSARGRSVLVSDRKTWLNQGRLVTGSEGV